MLLRRDNFNIKRQIEVKGRKQRSHINDPQNKKPQDS